MKKRFNTLVLTLVACYCLSILPMIFTSCANSSGGNGSGNENNSTASVSSVIGAAGGQVGDENASITIPAGALDSDTTITVKYLPNKEDISDGPMLGFAGAVEFGPSGTQFNTPAEVMVKLSQSPKNQTLSIFCYDEENERWNYETTAETIAGYAMFEVNHFSKYRIIDVTDDLLQKYIDIILSNFNNHISDTVSRQQYMDFLVNTVKVMDTYDEWNGMLYKACGFLISANYYINGVEDDPDDLIALYGEDSDTVKTGDLLYDTYKSDIINGEETEDVIIIEAFLSIQYKPVETYKFSGHITESYDYTFDHYQEYKGDNIASYTKLNATPGTLKIDYEYDYDGFIFVEEGEVRGSITFKNYKTKMNHSLGRSKYSVIWGPWDDLQESFNDYGLELFTKYTPVNNNLTCKIKGSCNDTVCDLEYDCELGDLTVIDAQSSLWLKECGYAEVFLGDDDYAIDSAARIRVGGDNTPLLSFSLDAEELKEKQSMEDSSLKDEFDIRIGLGSLDFWWIDESPIPNANRIMEDGSCEYGYCITGRQPVVKTTQTITVEKVEK